MSTTATQVVPAAAPAPPTKHRIPRKPTHESQFRVRECVKTLLAEGYDYEDAQTIFRANLIDFALHQAKGIKTKAARRLGISRDHVRDYRAKCADLL